MDNLNRILAKNLRATRKEKKLSLDQLAELCGVSKSMLGQIERCEVNPTVATMWKIAHGLKVPFSQFIDHTDLMVEQVQVESLTPIEEDNGKVKLYPLFPFDSGRRFEMYSVIMEPLSVLTVDGHLMGTQKFVAVNAGALILTLEKEHYQVEAGNALRLKAHSPHRFENIRNSPCWFHLTIHYPQ